MRRLIVLLALFAACSQEQVNTFLQIQPARAEVPLGTMLQLTVTGAAPPVAWAVVEGATGGTVANGLYTATCGISAGTYHITATAGGITSAPATMTVTGEKVLSVTVTPNVVTLAVGATQQLTANITTTCSTYQATQVVQQTAAGLRVIKQ